jgi:hypothetical protein
MLLLAAVFACTAYWVRNRPVDDVPRALTPEGWKISRRPSGWDVKSPGGKWRGWRYSKRSLALDAAWEAVWAEAVARHENNK